MPCLEIIKSCSCVETTCEDTRQRKMAKRAIKQKNKKVSMQCLLSTVADWEFNVFTMDKLTNGRPLFHAGLRMLQDHGLIEHFRLDVVKLMRCITLIEDGYHNSNPYHNAVHAVDVGQAMHCYLKQHKVSQYLTPLEKLIAIFSALAHDVEHPGVNNAFLIATSNHLAALYNNVSVLEYHHWRTTMSIFHDSGLFEHLDKDTLDSIEWQMKSLILATDITRQAEFLSKFKEVLDKDDLNLKREKDRHFMLQIALKVADISNPGRPWEVSRRWSELVCDEFFKQGDYERKLGLPVTPLNDRFNTTVAKIQSGFMQFVVLPLFNEWRRFNPSELSNKMIANITANKKEWDAIICQQAQEAEKEQQEKAGTIEEEEEELEPEVEEEEEESEDGGSIAGSPPKMCHHDAPIADFIQVGKKHRLSIPHSSDGENSDVSGNEEEDDDSEFNIDDITSGAEVHLMSFMPRRHSLPVSSLNQSAGYDIFNTLQPSDRTDSDLSSRGGNRVADGQSHVISTFSMLARRRHSLPASALPNIGLDIFEQLSGQLDMVAECSFNDQNDDHLGEKISLQSLNPGALPDANREASKLTSAHGLEDMRSQFPAGSDISGNSDTSGSAAAKEMTSQHSLTNDIAQLSPSLKHKRLTNNSQNSSFPLSSSSNRNHHYHSHHTASKSTHHSKHTPAAAKHRLQHHLNNSVKDCSGAKVSHHNALLGMTSQQRCVLLGRERAVSIPTHYRIQAALREWAETHLASRRCSMGDQPIYLDTTPLLNSPGK